MNLTHMGGTEGGETSRGPAYIKTTDATVAVLSGPVSVGPISIRAVGVPSEGD